MTAVPAAAPTGTSIDVPSRRGEILGRVDIADARRISGWAWDQGRPTVRLEVEVRAGDRILATTIADRARPDLQRNGIGDGCHAFLVRIEPTDPTIDPATVVATIVGPDLSEPVPLFRPTETQVEIERTVLLPFARLHKTLDLIADRQLKLVRSCESLREVVPGPPEEGAGVLERIVSAQERTEARLDELDVYQTRFDTALRALSEERASTVDRGERALKGAVALLAAATLLSSAGTAVMIARAFFP